MKCVVIGLSVVLALYSAVTGTAEEEPTDRVLWADDFESYTSLEDMFSRGDGRLNRWYALAKGGNRSYQLTQEFSRSGKQSFALACAQATKYGNTDLYRKIPLSLIQGKVKRIGYEGWIAFDHLEAHRLILMCEVWTGKEKHFGHGPDKLIAR